MFTATRIMWINGIMFVAILALSVSIITKERRLPGEPQVKEYQRMVSKEIQKEAVAGGNENTDIKTLGSVSIFETVIPLPTRTPTPTPAPPKPPDIKEVTQLWKLSFVFNSMATFQNVKTQEEFTIKVGDKQVENFRGQEIPVYLKSVDRKQWTATVIMNYMNEEQSRTFSMFD